MTARPDRFADRHIGPRAADLAAMCQAIGVRDLDHLVEQVVPPAIRSAPTGVLPTAADEAAALAELRAIAGHNRVVRAMIGQGYHGTHTPAVIQRGVLENPGWYTQYTPYQAEISQGRLECLLIYQTMIADLTGLPVANASLLDEATAAAEAMHVAVAATGRKVVCLANDLHPQTAAVVRTRAEALGIAIRAAEEVAGAACVIAQYPGTDGVIRDLRPLITAAKAAGALSVVCCDLLACTVLTPPGELGADIAVGSSQRFGVPMGAGGPHAGFLACREAQRRIMPGRIVGISKDRRGTPALRLALQTREQHIRREKATSNICTAQALLANMAALYACWHGPEGLSAIAQAVRALVARLAAGLAANGIRVADGARFDTLRIDGVEADDVLARASVAGLALRRIDARTIAIALDETHGERDAADVLAAVVGKPVALPITANADLPEWLVRRSPFLGHRSFHAYRSETAMLRFIKKLEGRDLSLTAAMIPLGSCTMKLNAAAEMLPMSWAEITRLHPFQPASELAGTARIVADLEAWLGAITGLPGVSLQPNAGSQGEYAGLLAIRAWHRSRGEGGRDLCLIPVSAHGTNPASAAMAGLGVVAIACDARGDIDLADLQAKIAANAPRIACLMVTYPSTHGVFEAGIREAAALVHAAGGQVYMDGANMNAQVGLTSPAAIGADVCHLNLHKTFAIPHGGGGPGVGPVCVAEHLRPFLPGDPRLPVGHAVSAAPWGSASILVIPWAYIRMMGGDGLTRATQVALLNANYIAHRLAPHFPVLYTGAHGRVAHECIIDLRPFKAAGVEAEDVAKRLMDYGFHAPTLSFPVVGTLMIEPTESEPKEELDRFCDAMIAISAEIAAVADGRADKTDNVLKNAPHVADEVCGDIWTHAYGREVAAFPLPWVRERKFWPAVARIDATYGDRNPMCSCSGWE